jgi:glycosyltransferase involved in cell wall biosynthesis
MSRDISIWARGVDREQFNPGRRDMDWRRGLGIAHDEMTIAFLGRIVMEKGLPEFVAAIDALAQHKVEYRVLVIGDGPARAWFEERLPGAVFVGHQEGPNLARALASADVFINPSNTETFGTVTLEAMACALPVVAADATGATSLVRDGETGTLVEAGDADAFGDALAAYARDPALRQQHGAAGLEFAKTMDWDRINDAVLQVYRRVLARRERYDRLKRR